MESKLEPQCGKKKHMAFSLQLKTGGVGWGGFNEVHRNVSQSVGEMFFLLNTCYRQQSLWSCQTKRRQVQTKAPKTESQKSAFWGQV